MAGMSTAIQVSAYCPSLRLAGLVTSIRDSPRFGMASRAPTCRTSGTSDKSPCLPASASPKKSKGQVWLLNPHVVGPDGEWEAWDFASWHPGEVRYRSFWDLMEYQFGRYLA